MATRDFQELLGVREEAGLRVCVGLDPDYDRIPAVIREGDSARYQREVICAFLRPIIEATKDLALAYKPNRAFFEAQGIPGLLALHDIMGFLLEEAPQVPVIFDAKYGDIGNTNKGYATFTYDVLGADAVTLNPYLGGPETLKPFLRPGKGAILLCRTTNPEAKVFQDLLVQADIGMLPFYQVVAYTVRKWTETYPGCGLVAGATYPEELAQVRQIVGDSMALLIPGVGTQGGEAEATVRAGANSKGRRMVINASSSILFASSGPDFAEAARAAAQKLHDQIQAALTVRT